jgi:hypothetical protein
VSEGSFRSLLAVLLLAAVFLAAPPLVADDYPVADDPDDLRARVLAHRHEEAAAKARRAELLRGRALRTPNQFEYDFVYYDLDLNLDPTARILSGTVIATAEVVGTSVTTMDLNLRNNMAVSGATCGGLPATFSHANHVLTVDLDRTYTTGEIISIGVTYSGNPASDYFAWSSHSGQDMIWTLSEPYGARRWWPCKDFNEDKPDSLDMRVTVPDHLIVASNGSLVSDVDHGATRTFHWHCGYPIAPYLVSLAIYPYTTYSDWYTPQGGGTPMEVQFYVFPDHIDDVQTNYAKTVPMIDAFAQSWGEYPFLDEKYGHAEFTWGGGMEHQTISSLGGWSEDLISHELAHQWFGDYITCNTFHHIWLNEGFATWSEARWKEVTEGSDTYQEYMDFGAYYGPGTIYVETPNASAIFDVDLSYNKASWVVHMLRHVVGDTDFFAGLELYQSTYGYGTATTEQFRDVMEAASGKDLDAFFQQWIYGEYFPVYRYTWTPSGEGIDLVIEQIQTNTGLFTMPIDVRIETTTGTHDLVVQNAAAVENYALSVSGDVQAVSLDPERWILRRVESLVTDPTFAQGILVVNGVHWDTYGAEITSAYADSVFWGDNPISFWDTFAEPASGYPANLPTPLGHGPVPGDIIGDFSAVVWVGNDYAGDLVDWFETPIASYLDVGGNLLLMSRRGANFVESDLAAYLGITWTQYQITLGNCTSTYPGLGDIPFTGSQSWNDAFSTTVGPVSTLLFEDTSGSDRGTGVHAQPTGGGVYRPDGGQFVYVAGRPYRMNHAALRANVEFILESFFGEPYSPPTVSPAVSGPVTRLSLAPNRPNPITAETLIPFSIPVSGPTRVSVYDVGGRLVRTLIDDAQPAGDHAVRWDARDARGRRVAAGMYFVRLQVVGRSLSRPVVVLR